MNNGHSIPALKIKYSAGDQRGKSEERCGCRKDSFSFYLLPVGFVDTEVAAALAERVIPLTTGTMVVVVRTVLVDKILILTVVVKV